MGIPLPENPAGAACANCWGVGKPFGTGSTPQIITVQLVDWSEGQAWDEIYKSELTLPHSVYQLAIPGPCFYQSVNDILDWKFAFEAIDTRLEVESVPAALSVFTSAATPPCTKTVMNTVVDGPFAIIFGGHAEITWSEIFT